jgi:DNA-binding sugar fermentation-stimulating protein
MINLAVCVEPNKNPSHKTQYKIWYLELDSRGHVVGINVKSREQLVQSVLENFQKTGKTNWRCFQTDKESSTEIEVYDFISMNSFENTHFGNLPTLSEFQKTLDSLQTNLELRSIA